MNKYDVVVNTDRGHLAATLSAPENIPTGLLLQAVMSHQQLLPHLVELGANSARTLLVTTPSRLTGIKPGLTIEFSDGVAINGPLQPSPIPNVPPQFAGVQLTYGLAAHVKYAVNLASDPEDDGWDDDTH